MTRPRRGIVISRISRRRIHLVVLGGVVCTVMQLAATAFAEGSLRASSTSTDRQLRDVSIRDVQPSSQQPHHGGHPAPWLDRAEQLDTLTLKDLQRLCASSLVGDRQQQAAVVRGALDEKWLGFGGRVSEVTGNSTFALFTAGHDGQNTFSRGVHKKLRSLVQPSAALWRQLVSSKQAWAMRGVFKLDQPDVSDLLGAGDADMIGAFDAGESSMTTSVSLFSGAGGTRTPLHVDNIHALIFQVEGTKRFFTSTRPDIADAVSRGSLPEAVLHDGSTDVFCVDGSLEEVHGLCQPKPPRAHGAFVELHPGDCLVLPAGLYHDVEAAPDTPASLSLTVRFDSSVIAESPASSPIEVLKHHGLPILAFHSLVWLSTIVVAYAVFSMYGPETPALFRYLPDALAERLDDGLVTEPFNGALHVADALSPVRLALTFCAAPFVARVAQQLQWLSFFDDMIWAIDNRLGGSLRESARAAASFASRATS